MEYKFNNLSLKLNNDCKLGVMLPNGKRLLTEATVAIIEPKLIVSIYPKEHEPPHFLISTSDRQQSCRFSLKTFEPIDSMPRNIKKYQHNIINFFKLDDNNTSINRNIIIQKYNEMRPSDAPPQSLYE